MQIDRELMVNFVTKVVTSRLACHCPVNFHCKKKAGFVSGFGDGTACTPATMVTAHYHQGCFLTRDVPASSCQLERLSYHQRILIERSKYMILLLFMAMRAWCIECLRMPAWHSKPKTRSPHQED